MNSMFAECDAVATGIFVMRWEHICKGPAAPNCDISRFPELFGHETQNMIASMENGDATVRKGIEQDSKENVPLLTSAVRLDRSPHPYHRRQPNCFGSRTESSQTLTSHHLRAIKPPLHGPGHSKESPLDAKSGRSWKQVTSSDSGTEADDESGGVLRGLPAPPTKRRSSSPVLMPRHMDDERRRFWQHEAKHQGHRPILSLRDEENRKIRDKFARRRRAEYLRRLSETILLGSVGFISCGKKHEPLLRTLSRGVLSSGRRAMRHPDGRL